MALCGAAIAAEENVPAPTCAAGDELQNGVCYTKCPDGFRADGILCKQICPERTQDTGPHCLSGPAQFRKKIIERPRSQS